MFINSTTYTNPISGNTISGNTAIGSGGGIYLDNSAPNITFNTITNNTATFVADNNSRGFGGGIFVTGNDISPLISGNTIDNNTATSSGNGNSCGYGGGIYLNQSPATIQNNNIRNNVVNSTGTGTGCGIGGGVYLYQTISNLITGNTISGNTATYLGGGLHFNRSNPTLTNNTIDANIVTAYMDSYGYGGGISIYRPSTAGSPILSNNIITNNQANEGTFASAGYGGGIYIYSNVSPSFTSNTIANNSSSQRGGAIYIRDNSSNAIFNRNNINNNNSANGGAIYLAGNMTSGFYNNLIHNNSATNGGGIYFRANDNCIFLNNTVTDNSASSGGAFYCSNDSDLHLRNSIFWGNSATINGNTAFLSDAGSDPYTDFCDVEGGAASFAGAGAIHYVSCIDIDPQFSDGVYHITLGTSPCIGAGDPATGTGNFPSDQDFDAEKRVRGVVDIGAYETNNEPQFVLSYPPVVDNPGPETITINEDEEAPLPFSLTLLAIDLDDEDITWSIITAPGHGAVNIGTATTSPPNTHSNNTIDYDPTPNYNGSDMFRVQISDGTLTDLIQIDITINSINDEPYFTTNPSLFTKANKTWTYNIATNDVDHALNTLTLTCPTLPAGMGFVAGADGTGVLTWTPTDAQVSPPLHTVTLRVQDPDGAFVEQTFDITVGSRFIYVPADYPTIQQAINAAVDGEDKIFVASGTYQEHINTNGKTIEIEGDPSDPTAVIIDGTNTGPCVVIDQGGAPIINGFTFTNGAGQIGLSSASTYHAPASGYYGGALVCYNSFPNLYNLIAENNYLIVNNNHGGSGGAFYIGQSSIVVMDNIIIQNNATVTYRGGGICIDDSDVTVKNSDIQNNTAGNYGGGIAVYNSTLDLQNVNVTGNTVDGLNGRGGGIYSHNSIVTKDGPTSVTGNSASVSGNNQFTYP